MKALYFKKFGGPEVLRYGEVASPIIKANDLLIKTHYLGLNFADIYRRRGTYHLVAHTPYINGYEGIGEIIQIGQQVSGFRLGERILFVDVPLANAELVRVPVSHAIRVPKMITAETAVGIGLQGLTADFLVHDLAQSRHGDTVFIQGISGGVGQILTQILAAAGCQVYGFASTEAKRQIALKNGAKAVFLRSDNWQVRKNNFFDTVFDGVGVTVPQSLKLLKHRGRLIFYGMAGGEPPKVDPPALLSVSKSILTGDLWDYLTSFQARKQRSEQLFHYLLTGKVKIAAPTIFPLEQGRAAHEFLESGRSSGKILLQPGE